jgi:protein subunit release factor A
MDQISSGQLRVIKGITDDHTRTIMQLEKRVDELSNEFHDYSAHMEAKERQFLEKLHKEKEEDLKHRQTDKALFKMQDKEMKKLEGRINQISHDMQQMHTTSTPHRGTSGFHEMQGIHTRLSTHPEPSGFHASQEVHTGHPNDRLQGTNLRRSEMKSFLENWGK